MYSLTFRVRIVAIAMQPMHRLQIRPIVRLGDIPYQSPKLHPGLYTSVGMWPRTNRQNGQTDRQADRHM